MKRFQSKIEALQRVREQEEQLARLEAAVCQNEKMKADQRLSTVQQQIAAAESSGVKELADGRIEIVQTVCSTVRRLEAERQAAEVEQTQAQHKLVLAIQKVAEAKARLKIADSHIDRERTEHRRQMLTEEENNRQENTAQRYARREVTT